MLKLSDYKKIIVSFSGGKDSIYCVLDLLKKGVKPNQIELWHNCIDGKSETFMDWECTESYCQVFADHFGIPIYYSWKDGGFEKEMTRNNEPTATNYFEVPSIDGGRELRSSGGKGKPNTRRKYPQVSASLSTRWCSAYLKIDVFAAAVRNQERFNDSETLVITGERAEESSNRARYKVYEIDRADNRHGKSRRLVDHLRPAHPVKEAQVWDIIKEFKINPHPAYLMGWGRLSCMTCIFGSANQWASVNKIDPGRLQKQFAYEIEFETTIHRKYSIEERISQGTPYPAITEKLAALSMSKEYTDKIILEDWQLPAGAFGENCGAI